MNYGYDVKSPYVSAAASQSDDSSLVFVSNGDGSGELYTADMKGLPDLSHQLAGIRTDASPGKYVPYDVDGSEELPCSSDEAWKFIEQGYDRPGVVMYQAIKLLPADVNGIRYAASVKRRDDVWITITYATVDDGFYGVVSEFNSAMRREETVSKTMPDYIIRVVRYADAGDLKHVLCAV